MISDKEADNLEEILCPICLDIVNKNEENEEIINKCCNRSYHKECIKKWNKNCPTCRSNDSVINSTNNTTIILIHPQPSRPSPEAEVNRRFFKSDIFILVVIPLFGIGIVLFCMYKIIELSTLKKHK